MCQDDPRATQPLTYQKILNHPTTLQIYSQKLLQEGIITQNVRPCTFIIVLTSLNQKVTLLAPICVKLEPRTDRIFSLIFFLQVLDKWVDDVDAKFEAEYAAADSHAPTLHEWLASNWQGKPSDYFFLKY